MVKAIFSKVLWVGGARVSTVGLGVILGVILGLAAVPATGTPAAAQTDNPWVSFLRHELVFDKMVNADASESFAPHSIQVRTWWELDHPEKCPVPLHQRLFRQTGNEPLPGTLIDDFSSYGSPNGVNSWYQHTLKLNTSYQYFLGVTCPPLDSGGSFGPAFVEDEPFGIRLEEDTGVEPMFLPIFQGAWNTAQGAGFSGGTTHQATQLEPRALLAEGGFAAGWVTTRDPKPTLDEDRAKVFCNERNNVTGTPVQCADVTTSVVNAPGQQPLYKRVKSAGWLSRWDSTTEYQLLRVVVVPEDAEGVDVDAFVIVEECASIFSRAC
jgi:hypothetical protein